MSQYPFTTREIGPNAKGQALTFDELDESLLFLSSSLIPSSSVNNLSQSIVELTAEVLILSQSINEIDFHPLSGSNYIFVEANGTPTQNGGYLTASYALAKLTIPTITDRFSVLLGPGYYEFNSDFNIDTEYIDVVSLTGDRDVYITGSNTIVIGADNVYVRGIDVDTKNFTITSSFPNTIIKNCKGGDESFGGDSTLLNPFTMAGTFIDCEGGTYSFAGYGSAYGTFINCIGGNESFGNYCDGTFTDCIGGNNSFATLGNIEGGTFENCTAGDASFATIGTIKQGSKLIECVGGINSFTTIGNGLQKGYLQECRVTAGNTFPNNIASQIGSTGQLVNCITPGSAPINAQ
jgi:hypothetical protein